ncbi:MAG: hypothetical protein DLM58_05850 [Pseudonocardiales bacterium]|nr:MAG: hypothetical protein DLM58_05850 [Pseudonocardiales bacterium]
MKPDQLLYDVFAAQADSRPDPCEVLAAVHERLDRPTRPRRAPARRVATMVAAAAAVFAVASTAAVLSNRSHGQHVVAVPAGSHSSSPATVTSARPAHPSSSPTGGPTRVSLGSRYPYSTIAAGWLPGPGHQVMATNNPGFEQRDYAVTVDGTAMDVIIWTTDGSALPSSTEAGSNYRDIVINGHAARQFTADVATIVAVDLGNGKIAYAGPSVVATTSQVSTTRIADIAVHVARETLFNRHDVIPAGLNRIAAVHS